MKTSLLKSFAVVLLILVAAFTTTETKPVDASKSSIKWVGHKVTGQHEGTITLLVDKIPFVNLCNHSI